MSRAPLRFAPPVKCHRDLGPGEVKRVAAGKLLVGYFIGCPACGVVNQLPGEAFVEEGPLIEQPAGPGVSAKTKRPTSLRFVAPQSCRGCGRSIGLREEEVLAW